MEQSINPFKKGAFRFNNKPEGTQMKRIANSKSYLADRKAWEQYTNPFIYEFDKLLRTWIKDMSANSKWFGSYMMRRYTMSMIYENLYGRPYDQSLDGKNVNAASRILAYYSSRIQKGGSIYGKKYSKNIYTISPRRLKYPAYSLKLRLELMSEEGIVPDNRNMALPKDNLEAGHARRSRTEANMERRRREAKDRYNARYNSKHNEGAE